MKTKPGKEERKQNRITVANLPLYLRGRQAMPEGDVYEGNALTEPAWKEYGKFKKSFFII